jgi:hypothetical protein
MKRDYKKNPHKYDGNPDYHLFQNNPENLYVFCENNNFLKDSDVIPKTGDIAFFGKENAPNHVALVQTSCDSINVYDAGIKNKVDLLNIDEVAGEFGEVMGYCRIIN